MALLVGVAFLLGALLGIKFRVLNSDSRVGRDRSSCRGDRHRPRRRHVGHSHRACCGGLEPSNRLPLRRHDAICTCPVDS